MAQRGAGLWAMPRKCNDPCTSRRLKGDEKGSPHMAHGAQGIRAPGLRTDS